MYLTRNLIVTSDSTGYLPIAINHQWTFNFCTFSINGRNVVFVHGFAVAKIANTDTLQNDFSCLFLCQVIVGSNFFHLMAGKDENSSYCGII